MCDEKIKPQPHYLTAARLLAAYESGQGRATTLHLFTAEAPACRAVRRRVRSRRA